MNRKTFLATIAAILSAPFVVKSEPKPEPPNLLPPPVEVEDVEKYVQAEIDRRLKVVVKGDDLVYIQRGRKNGKTAYTSALQEYYLKNSSSWK